MKRFYTAIVIMAFILGVCSYSLILFRTTKTQMVQKLDAIQTAVAAQTDSGEVQAMCAEYAELWNEKEKHLIRFIRHPQLDDITAQSAELQYLAMDDGYSHLLAAIARIRINLDRVGGAEVFFG